MKSPKHIASKSNVVRAEMWVCWGVGIVKCKSVCFLLALIYAIKQLLYYWRCSFLDLKLHASYNLKHAPHSFCVYLWPPEVYQAWSKQIRSDKARKWVWYMHGCVRKCVWQTTMLFFLLALLYATTFSDSTVWRLCKCVLWEHGLLPYIHTNWNDQVLGKEF